MRFQPRKTHHILAGIEAADSATDILSGKFPSRWRDKYESITTRCYDSSLLSVALQRALHPVTFSQYGENPCALHFSRAR
jgi:hypothetical protein